MNTKQVPEIIIFDLDGTLLDSEKATFDIAAPILSRHLGRNASSDELNSLKGRAWKTALEDWFPGRGSCVYEEILDKWNNAPPLVSVYEGVHELLTSLRSAGVRLGIASSNELGVILELLMKHSMDSYFETVVGQNDTQKHKPNPEPLILAAKRMNVDRSKCLYVGDQPWDIAASRAAGMSSGAAVWGEGDLPALMATGPDYIFTKPSEVLSVFVPQ